MPFSPIEEIVEDIKQGKMVIVCDDEDRENEGDLTMAAELVTADDINFMATHGRGLICLPMAEELLDRLDIPRLAGLKPAGVICEIMKEDGTMARVPDLEKFSAEHDIKLVTTAQIIEYRHAFET